LVIVLLGRQTSEKLVQSVMDEADILFQITEAVANLFEVIDPLISVNLQRLYVLYKGLNVQFVGLVRLFPFV
jgi:hypothetical protein